MPANPNLEFSPPIAIYQSDAHLPDGNGNIFRITLVGSEDRINTWREARPIHVELLTGDAAKQWTDYLTQRREVADIVASDEFPDPDIVWEPERILEIYIAVEETKLEEYTIRLHVDPDLQSGEADLYHVSGVQSAWAVADVSFGDVSLRLLERRADDSWVRRDRSVNAGAATETVSAERQFTGRWRVRALGIAANSRYTLDGSFGTFL